MKTDKELNRWPTTFDSALEALIENIPAEHRSGYQDILYDVFMEKPWDNQESDEEE